MQFCLSVPVLYQNASVKPIWSDMKYLIKKDGQLFFYRLCELLFSSYLIFQTFLLNDYMTDKTTADKFIPNDFTKNRTQKLCNTLLLSVGVKYKF